MGTYWLRQARRQTLALSDQVMDQMLPKAIELEAQVEKVEEQLANAQNTIRALQAEIENLKNHQGRETSHGKLPTGTLTATRRTARARAIASARAARARKAKHRSATAAATAVAAGTSMTEEVETTP